MRRIEPERLAPRRAGRRGGGRSPLRHAPAAAPTLDRKRFRRLFTAVMVPMFLAAVDQTLLATATPVISRELGSLRDTSWLAVAYLLASVIMVPLYGRLGDRYGRRTVLSYAIAVFALGSLACGAGADARDADRGARAARPRRRRPDDALAGADRRGRRAAPARPEPELLRDHLHARQRRRAGDRRAGRASRELALAVPGQPAALRDRGLAPAHDARRRPPARGARQARRARHRPVRAHRRQRPDLALVGRPSVRVGFADEPGAVRGGGRIRARRWFGSSGASSDRSCRSSCSALPAVRYAVLTVIGFASAMFAMVFYLPVYLQLALGSNPAESGLLLLPLTGGIVAGAFITGRVIVHTGRPTAIPSVGLTHRRAVAARPRAAAGDPAVAGRPRDHDRPRPRLGDVGDADRHPDGGRPGAPRRGRIDDLARPLARLIARRGRVRRADLRPDRRHAGARRRAARRWSRHASIAPSRSPSAPPRPCAWRPRGRRAGCRPCASTPSRPSRPRRSTRRFGCPRGITIAGA